MAWYNFWKKKPLDVVDVLSEVNKAGWRNGMWVMTSKGIGIIFLLGYQTEVHLVDPKTGETYNKLLVPLQSFRLATFKEIPPSRKIGLSPEKAAFLGYM